MRALYYLTTDNPKTARGASRGFVTAVLHLAPGKLAKRENVCPNATGGPNGCLRNCLFHGGRGKFENVREARIRKTRELFDRPEIAEAQLIADVAELAANHERVALRLNGTSDLDWCGRFPRLVRIAHELGVILYDYTKRPDLIATYPSWYDLTFSYSGKNEDECRRMLEAGRRVAVVFPDAPPRVFWGHDVVDGDRDDLRFIDPSPCVVALTPKGLARGKTGGLVASPHG